MGGGEIPEVYYYYYFLIGEIPEVSRLKYHLVNILTLLNLLAPFCHLLLRYLKNHEGSSMGRCSNITLWIVNAVCISFWTFKV